MDSLLKNLNEAQKKAVLHKDGPLLVLAGAGAGKTKAIAHRVAYLVSQGVNPENILAITFTNKAANEMKERIMSLLKPRTPNPKPQTPFVSTFHSLGAYILRKHGKYIGITKNFTILDKEDSLGTIKEAMKELNIDLKQFQPAKMSSIISRQKGELVEAEEFLAQAGGEFFPRILGMIWKKYEDILNEHKSLDFDDLITKTFLLLQKNKEVREFYQNLWKYILIDEYQDTNKSQYEFSKILAEKHKNICAIGDMDQAIYSWRGADFRNIINFENEYPEHITIIFEENYRSTKTILEAAAKVIEKNKMRKPKKLISKKEFGSEIILFEAMNEEEEANFVAHQIKDLLKKKNPATEIAVLYRANFQSRILEEVCLKHGILYHVVGTQFYDRKEIKDIFAYLRASLNPKNLLDLKRIINVPARGIGKTAFLNYVSKKKLPEESEKRMKDFLKLLESIKEKTETNKASEVIKYIMKQTGLQKFLESGTDDDKERLENIKELVTITTRYDESKPPEGIEKFITDVTLMADQDSIERKQKGVRLMTVHSAKGLEFGNVFIVGLEDGLFPHGGFGDNSSDKQEEERRLFYVAITRAKDRLFLSFSVSRTIFGSKQLNMPSRFLSDIPEHLMRLADYRDRPEEIIRY